MNTKIRMYAKIRMCYVGFPLHVCYVGGHFQAQDPVEDKYVTYSGSFRSGQDKFHLAPWESSLRRNKYEFPNGKGPSSQVLKISSVRDYAWHLSDRRDST